MITSQVNKNKALSFKILNLAKLILENDGKVLVKSTNDLDGTQELNEKEIA